MLEHTALGFFQGWRPVFRLLPYLTKPLVLFEATGLVLPTENLAQTNHSLLTEECLLSQYNCDNTNNTKDVPHESLLAKIIFNICSI